MYCSPRSLSFFLYPSSLSLSHSLLCPFPSPPPPPLFYLQYPYIHLDFSHWGEEEEEEKADESDTEKEKEKQAKQTNPKETVTPPPASTPWYMIALYVILWLLIWGFFIEIEFGVVYLLTSAFAFIFLSLRGSRRRIGELSAYSVFNENCESLQGTLTAEQFEREIRYGPTSVR